MKKRPYTLSCSKQNVYFPFHFFRLSSVKLLGIEIDHKLNFEKHISNICQKSQQPTKCNLQTANIYGS